MTHAPARIGVLDGLRALAILLVLARHSLKPLWTDPASPFLGSSFFDPAALLLNGWVGVDLFFVLSGFLIASQLLRAYASQASVAAETAYFYKKRFFRIAPAYYFVLTIVCLGVFPGYPQADPQQVWGWRYVYHLLFLNDYFPSDILVVFWSLAIEAKFYLLAPLLVYAVTRLPHPRARLLLFAAILGGLLALRAGVVIAWFPGTDSYNDYFASLRNRFHLCLDSLVMGALCATIWADRPARSFFEKPAVANAAFFTGTVFLLGLCAPAVLLDNGVNAPTKIFLPAALGAGFSLMMLGLLGGCKASRFFGAQAWKGIALISYSLYLVHMPLLYPSFLLATALAGRALSPQAAWIVMLPVFFGLSVLASYFLYSYVEKPFIDWAKKRRVQA